MGSRSKLRSSDSPSPSNPKITPLSKAQPLSQSPATTTRDSKKKKALEENSSTMDLIAKIEKSMLAQTEAITSQITSQIADSEKTITDKISKDVTELKLSIESINTRLSLIEAKQAEFEPLKEEIRELKQQILEQDDKIKTISMQLESNDEHQLLKETMSDALLHGVPLLPNENLRLIFNQLCTNLNFKSPTIKSIFRIRPKTDTESPSPPIVIKFFTPHDKLFVLRSIAEYRRTTKAPLQLHDLGLRTDSENATGKSNVFIHESLTPKNRYIMQNALKMKRNKQLHSVFTIRGLVYVKKSKDEEAQLIETTDDLADTTMMTQTTTTNDADK